MPTNSERSRRARMSDHATIRRLLAVVVCGMLAGGAALANPSGPTVAHGTVQFARPGANTLDVTASSNAIINWQGFSVDAGETTRFIQPSAIERGAEPRHGVRSFVDPGPACVERPGVSRQSARDRVRRRCRCRHRGAGGFDAGHRRRGLPRRTLRVRCRARCG